MTRKLNCVIESVCAILGFEPIVSTNWIFDDDDDEVHSKQEILFPIAHFYMPVYAFVIFHNPSLLPFELYCNKEPIHSAVLR